MLDAIVVYIEVSSFVCGSSVVAEVNNIYFMLILVFSVLQLICN